MNPREIFDYKCSSCGKVKEPNEFGSNVRTGAKLKTCNRCRRIRAERKERKMEALNQNTETDVIMGLPNQIMPPVVAVIPPV